MSADWTEGPLSDDGIAGLGMAAVLFGSLWFGGNLIVRDLEFYNLVGLFSCFLFWATTLLYRVKRYPL